MQPNIRPLAPFEKVYDDFVDDAVALFTGQKQGHMERWEYSPSLYRGDLAGGGAFWADLVKRPGKYYLTVGDTQTIQWAVTRPDLQKILADVKVVVELGPGSKEAIVDKTMPFLNACSSVQKYMAVDATLEQAADASRIVAEGCALDTGIRGQNYIESALSVFSTKKTAIVMWGSSLGNIDGFANADPYEKLVKILKNFSYGLKRKDLLILCHDTEVNKGKVIQAYSEPSLKGQILSVLYRLKRDGYATGRFDPKLWRHEAVWFSDVRQCAHVIYPLFEQTINIQGTTIHIPAWRRHISNNSYKLSQETVARAAADAGMSTHSCFQKGPIAMHIFER